MQHNFQQKNKSNLIRLTEDAKRKSRHRLMGSVFLLLIALVVLLNVTSKVKPIPLKPQNIEIKNGQSQALNTVIQESPQINNKTLTNQQSSQIITTIIPTKPQLIKTINNADNLDSKLQVPLINNNEKQINKDNSTNKNMPFSPRIFVETHQEQKPENILNGTNNNSTSNRYFIQLIASNNKVKLIELQKNLNKHNISTFIQQIQTTNGAIYRLRIGPFTDKEKANKILTDIFNIYNITNK